MSKANDQQVGGNHYHKRGAVQHWDIVWQHELDYWQGQITKYVMRWKDKNGIQDLEKARHFLDKYIELQQQTKVQPPTIRTSGLEGTYYHPSTVPGPVCTPPIEPEGGPHPGYVNQGKERNIRDC